MSELWKNLHDLFDTDDGSLPEVEIYYSNGKSICDAYALIRDHSESFGTETRTYHLRDENRDVEYDFSDNPSDLVVKGIAESTHVVFSGVHGPSGQSIPPLGVFVWPDGISIDFRMGKYWISEALIGFFDLLKSLSNLLHFERLGSNFFTASKFERLQAA